MLNDSNSTNSAAGCAVAFKNVKKRYDGASVCAIESVSFRVEHGEFVIFVGGSGSGKSTILKLIAGLERPSEGEVVRPPRVAMAFQSVALLPWLTVFENAAFGVRAKESGEHEVRRAVEPYITLVGLHGLEEKFPRELSGGQQARVGLARALAVDPDILILDEPFAALDAKTTHDLHEDLIKIWQQTKKTILMVSHNIEEAVSLADRVLLVKAGRIECEWSINLPYPRREQAEPFMHEVARIRHAFFRE
ncbi:MAG: ABC transporter ATP-binding protein [Minisyncoccia bacterium]